MVRCTRNGCNADYEEVENTDTSCSYHPGNPVFHEGSKSWSCCSDLNKPVLEFEAFVKINGCAVDKHSTEPRVTDPLKTVSHSPKLEGMIEKEKPTPPPVGPTYIPRASQTVPAPVEEEEDDITVPVNPGTKCQRNGCAQTYISDDDSRREGGKAAQCVYHPRPPMFHEGSKGYLCCKRRVLEFDEFLRIEGCKTGRHVFVPKSKLQKAETVQCRVDHYQTLTEIHVSIFAKKVDKETSSIQFQENSVVVELFLPGSKYFCRTFDLFGPIDPDASKYTYYGTKVELNLKKRDLRSWTVLEKPTGDLGNISLTFGVGGRTGTIGAKEVVLDESNKARLT